MDGNNRWSKKNNLDLYNSYKIGANNLIKLTDFIFNNTKSNYVSAFALSKHNLNRSQRLITTLKKLLLEFVDNLIKDENKLKFNIKFIGDRNFLSSNINEKIERLQNKKKN